MSLNDWEKSGWLGNSNQFYSDVRQRAEHSERDASEQKSIASNWEKGWFNNNRGKYDLSRTNFQHFVKNVEERNFDERSDLRINSCSNFAFALLDLKQGFIDSAMLKMETMASQLKKMDQSWFKKEIEYYYNFLSVEILLAKGKLDSAIAAVKQLSPTNNWAVTFFSHKPYRRDVLARAYIQKGEIDKAISEYEQFTTLYPENKSPYLRHPTYHYRLAKLYEQKGKREKAIERYEKFLELWKNADKDQPELIDAKERLARISQ